MPLSYNLRFIVIVTSFKSFSYFSRAIILSNSSISSILGTVRFEQRPFLTS